MPAVFVHGVPDTSHVWDATRAHLTRDDIVTLNLPGFGCPVPAGFEATKEGYVAWLQAELAALPPPIDLVGHDWGGLLALRVVSLDSDAVRSWAVGGSPLDPAYEWHETAKAWQTPEVGEQMMAMATPELLAAGLVGGHVPEADARATASRVDATMKQCILTLYRSAVDVGKKWHSDLDVVTAPGVILWGATDPFVTPEFGERLADRTRARFVLLQTGHWWQLEQPAEVAAALERLWEEVR